QVTSKLDRSARVLHPDLLPVFADEQNLVLGRGRRSAKMLIDLLLESVARPLIGERGKLDAEQFVAGKAGEAAKRLVHCRCRSASTRRSRRRALQRPRWASRSSRNSVRAPPKTSRVLLALLQRRGRRIERLA